MSKVKGQRQPLENLSELKCRSTDIKRWLQSALEQGFEIYRSTSNHIIVKNPETGAISPQTTTHVGGRSLLNYRSSLRKIGVVCT